MRKEKDCSRPQLPVTARCPVPRRGAIWPLLQKGLLVLERGLRGLARPEPSATRARGVAASHHLAFSSEPRVWNRLRFSCLLAQTPAFISLPQHSGWISHRGLALVGTESKLPRVGGCWVEWGEAGRDTRGVGGRVGVAGQQHR